MPLCIVIAVLYMQCRSLTTPNNSGWHQSLLVRFLFFMMSALAMSLLGSFMTGGGSAVQSLGLKAAGRFLLLRLLTSGHQEQSWWLFL